MAGLQISFVSAEELIAPVETGFVLMQEPCMEWKMPKRSKLPPDQVAPVMVPTVTYVLREVKDGKLLSHELTHLVAANAAMSELTATFMGKPTVVGKVFYDSVARAHFVQTGSGRVPLREYGLNGLIF